MRIIKEKTLTEYCRLGKYKQAEDALRAWVHETRYSTWANSGELKARYRNASIINAKRVVFNIKGNDYRLIIDIEYKLGIVFVVWFGTHDEYNKLDVKTLRYEG
ncbi:MAG: type II toxin-antitoxin system HigB family toxin [Draconibacterium sp.]